MSPSGHVEIDYAAIVTFDELTAAYDQLTERLRALVTSSHLRPGRSFDSLCSEDGERLIVFEERDGHNFILVLEQSNRLKPFFVVPNERGKAGAAGGPSTAREVLGAALNRPLRLMANTYAWAGFAEAHGFANGAVPKDLYDQLHPKAEVLRQQELERLRSLLGTDWP